MWARTRAEEVNELNVFPKQAWEAAYSIKDGVKGHHTKAAPKSFKNAEGVLPTTPAENVNNVEHHFVRVFNNTKSYRAQAVESIRQREIINEIGCEPQWDEFKRAIVKLKNDKQPGANGVMPNAFKCMDNHNLSHVYQFIVAFWHGTQDYEEWHNSLGSLVPKKGDLRDLNKWRCISLMDVGSKILSCILTERMYILLEKHGVKTQFGATPLVGCPEGNFTLKSLLHLRHQHDLPSYVAFVDLVKAYDTANHDLIILLLAKYGAPPQLCEVIKRLYSDLTVTINIEGKKVSIPQTSGVRQGDNLSPVLFLLIMSAVSESLNSEWAENGINKVECRRIDMNNLEKGSLTGHSRHTLHKGIIFQLIEILYIDDGAFIFRSRADLARGLALIRTAFENFGLEMHIGRGETDSKTECVYFPTPGWFAPDPTAALPPPCAEIESIPITTISNQLSIEIASNSHEIVAAAPTKAPRECEDSRKARCDAKYNTCLETERIVLDDGSHVDFAKEFIYLGSLASYDLIDDLDIQCRISTASRSMGALKNLWDNDNIDMKTKYLFFLAIPINLLLWGCESWALKETAFDKLDVFIHRSVRRILKIKWSEVMDDHFSNKKARATFFNVPDSRSMIV